MRTALTILLLLSTSFVNADQYDWPVGSVGVIRKKAASLPVLLVFTSKSCGPCKAMIADEILPMTESGWGVKYYVPNSVHSPQTHIVIVDGDRYSELADQWKVEAFPTTIKMNFDTKTEIGRLVGFQTKHTLNNFYKGVATSTVRTTVQNPIVSSQRIVQTYTSAPVYVQTYTQRPMVIRKSGPTWTWPGDLKFHLMTTHGYSLTYLNSLTHNQLVALHDNSHNHQTTTSPVIRGGFRYQQGVHLLGMPLMGTYAVGSGSGSFSSNCPGGVCPR